MARSVKTVGYNAQNGKPIIRKRVKGYNRMLNLPRANVQAGLDDWGMKKVKFGF